MIEVLVNLPSPFWSSGTPFYPSKHYELRNVPHLFTLSLFSFKNSHLSLLRRLGACLIKACYTPLERTF
jgi:hypothetical protein